MIPQKNPGWIFRWNIFLTFKKLRQVTWFWIIFSTFGNPTLHEVHWFWKIQTLILELHDQQKTISTFLLPNSNWYLTTFYKEGLHTQNLTPWFYIFNFFSHNDTVVDAPKFEIFPHNLSILWVFLNQNLLICSSPTWIFMCKFFQNIFCVQNWLSFAVNSTEHLIF